MINYELLEFAMQLGMRYEARVTDWGRDEESNKQLGGHPKSWHLWKRGPNALHIVPSETNPKKRKQRMEWIAEDARHAGYKAIINWEKGHVHIEIAW